MPPSDIVERSVKDLRCMYTFEPFMLFLKAAFRAGGSASPASKSDLIDNYNHEEGTNDVSSSKGKELICDNRERTQSLCSSNW